MMNEAKREEAKRKRIIAFKRQQAALLYGYEDITLRREGDYALVEIEFEGRTYVVIRTALDSNFCDTVTPFGIEAIITGKETEPE